MSVEARVDGSAHTIIPAEGGEVWVEPCTADLFQVGTVDSYAIDGHKWSCADLTRAELIEFRNRIDVALQEGRR